MPDPTTGVGHVPQVSWNDVQVEMKDRLTSGRPNIHPNVVAIGLLAQLDRRFGGVYRSDESCLFLSRGLEPILDMPARDEQGMPR
jgi:hypothetical protein